MDAGQSMITVVDGSACMGDDKSKKQTENEAGKELATSEFFEGKVVVRTGK
jgi:hypothetical protein